MAHIIYISEVPIEGEHVLVARTNVLIRALAIQTSLVVSACHLALILEVDNGLCGRNILLLALL